ncbi:T9SS type A sorting domain-containing protein [Neolewinella antarctica]|uniref:Secretion system C-terminal sorting domain-containing protein n=1 Tax=Neolewinella antarctica TaxID=442734 RepID=A0ABX0X8S7_9BACT|nr:T9SS type A sorting domain-containing protein [Neolewinella antarctica]NJC25632.1 hypothetical protein [Neolewinella antarctica]
MKRFYLLCSLLTLLCTGVRAQIDVTVRVDMNGITIDDTGVHIVGTFNGFDPTATPMTETSPGSDIYEAVINRPADDNIEYKILNGNNYGGEEPRSPCSYEYNGNRVFTVPMMNTTLPTFVFGGCPEGVTRIPVTFRVDAANQDASQGVYVVGEMTGFNNDGFRQLSQVGGTTVYETTIMVPADLLKLNFKYSIGPDFGRAESTTPAPCANPDNSDRFYRLDGDVEETEVYFFNTCEFSRALPVELTLFEAVAAKKSVFVNWVTAAEEDVDFFRVERSVNGVDFILLREILASQNGRGNDSYRTVDEQPASGTNYYRLTTVDLDGTQHLEGVRTVSFRGSTGENLILYPNPVTDRLTVSFRGAGNISIVDVLGRPVYQAKATDGFNWTGVAELPAGRYYLRLETETGVSQASFIK